MAIGQVATERSYEKLERRDLERLRDLAAADLSDFFARHSRPGETGQLYADRLLMLCLCQGGAEHFVRGDRGIKDFDVWAFFSENPVRPFPYRRRGIKDFGRSKFGRHPSDTNFAGRRVDVIGRSIEFKSGQSASECVRTWLSERKTESARLIGLRPVVDLTYESGRVIWDPLK